MSDKIIDIYKSSNLKSLVKNKFRGDSKESPAKKLYNLIKDKPLFRNQHGRSYIELEEGKYQEVMSDEFKRYLQRLYFESFGEILGETTVKNVIQTLLGKLIDSKEVKPIYKRCFQDEEKIVYNLANEHNEVVIIEKEVIEVKKASRVLRFDNNGVGIQVHPKLEESDIFKIFKYLSIKGKKMRIMFLVYLCSCFLFGIKHPIAFFYGEKGSTKSTAARVVKRLVDPNEVELEALTNKIDDVALTISKNYLTVFDNVSTIPKKFSDLLCMVATGGSHSKRVHHSNEGKISLNLESCVVLTGIELIIERSDLLDRILFFPMERVEKKDRLTEEELWENFEEDKGIILSGIFETVALALTNYESVEVDELSRMADFNKYGIAIAESLGYSKEEFTEAYHENQMIAHVEAINENHVGYCLLRLMKGKNIWEGSMKQLFDLLCSVADDESISIYSNGFPKAPNKLRKHLSEIKSNLAELGVEYSITNIGACKKISIVNKKNNTIRGKKKVLKI